MEMVVTAGSGQLAKRVSGRRSSPVLPLSGTSHRHTSMSLRLKVL
jgi:hypothetical protein